MRKSKTSIRLSDYTESIQKQYMAEKAGKVLEVLTNRGYEFTCEEAMMQFFKQKVKAVVQGGITTYSIDDMPFCASGELVVSVKGKEIHTSFSFVEL